MDDTRRAEPIGAGRARERSGILRPPGRVPLARGSRDVAGGVTSEGTTPDHGDPPPEAHRDRRAGLDGQAVGARRSSGRARRRPRTGHRPDRRTRLRPRLADRGLDDRTRAAGAWRGRRRPCATDAPSSCPTAPTTTSSARRTRSAPTSPPTASAGRRAGATPAAARRGRARAHPRLRPQPHRVGAPLGPPPPGLVRPRRRRSPGRRPGRLLRGPLGRPPLDRPRTRPELPAVDRHRPARLPPPGRAAGDDPGAQGGRDPLRRGRLLDGDARARRRLPLDLGGTLGAAVGPPRTPPRSASSGGMPRAPSATSTRSSCSSARPTGATSGGSSSSASTTRTTSRCSTGSWPATSPSVVAHLRADDAYQRRSRPPARGPRRDRASRRG